MRDPARIPVILNQIKRVWERHPDLRLCQLIGNCFPAGDNFRREDDKLSERLEAVYSVDPLQREKREADNKQSGG